MDLFKHKKTGVYYRLIHNRDGDINIYLEVDNNNVPIVKKRPWSYRKQEQVVIISGYENLIKL